jgi:hypothetical protein
MKRKSIFVSKTAAAAFVTAAAGLAATFLPNVGEFITSNAGAILIGLGAVNFILRLVTKEKVELFPG